MFIYSRNTEPLWNGSCLCSKSLELKTHKFENLCMKVLERHLLADVCLMSRDFNKVFFFCLEIRHEF